MYRVVLTDVGYGMGFSPVPDVVVFETEDEKLALLKLSEYEKKHKCSGWEPILEKSVVRTVWEKVR